MKCAASVGPIGGSGARARPTMEWRDPCRAAHRARPMTNTREGLTNDQAAGLLREHGPNALPAAQGTTFVRRFLRQLRSPMIAVLLFAVVFDVIVWFVDAFEGWPVEGTVIAAVLLLNAGLGTFQ